MRGDAEGVFNRSTAAKSDISSRAGGNSTITSKEQNYVGFANFPNQVFRRAVKNGFEFTLMVVGQSGLGKSTFLNTLFLAEVATPRPPGQLPSTVKIDERTVRLMENGTLLTLTLVDTPGFGDQIDNSKCWEPINAFIDSKYLEYFSEETKIERKERVPDRCVHLCLYFIEPTGHCLKALDIELMKRLHERVNIIPVVAKADCLTQDEMKKFKAQILRDLDHHGIKVYQFPEPEDEDEKKQYDLLKTRLPFAIIGSNTMREEAGKRVRYREYPWGVVEVDNLNHNDFLALRDMVIRTNLIDLIGVTRAVHYENFRFRQMSRMPKDALDRDPFTQMEDEQRAKETELKQKKSQLDKLFDEKVAEKESKIDEREKKLSAREKELQRIIEDKKAAIERIRADVQDLRRGDSKSNLNAANENGQNPSPPGEKTKKKGSTLGLFTRN